MVSLSTTGGVTPGAAGLKLQVLGSVKCCSLGCAAMSLLLELAAAE
jgi:hypothetical protein